jgi:RNAse (barnase) inhibitor barstar
MTEVKQSQDLTVKGESIERIYGNFRDKRYLVNRRYQRKLVWTLDEKVKFIDSIAKWYPVPIVLLAEIRVIDRSLFEIIDGMQRLNAIMGFIENEYAVDEKYFDLNTMASTKSLLDAESLDQKYPVMDRDVCVRIASYTVPLSVYESSKEDEVDEVFRRINSGGRKLSRQELRIAGATGHFAEAVRKIATKVRGDVSAGDILLLNEMKKISIGSKELLYGIDVDQVFWIRQGILTKEQTRESRDEELIADILAYMLLETKPASRSEFLDDYFGFGDGEPSRLRFEEIELAVQKHTTEVVATDFQRTLDEIKFTLSGSSQTLDQLLFGVKMPRAPRYFQAIFLAFHKLIVTENKEVSDHKKLIQILSNMGPSIDVPDGGRWGSQDRTNAVNAVAGTISPAFQLTNKYDPARVHWITRLENILNQSYTEQAAYDFKQGFLRLDDKKEFDEASFEKILKTLAGIANIRKGTTGYVIVGVSDNKKDAERVQKIFGIGFREYERFCITGIEHEASAIGKNLDQMFQMVTGKIKQSPLSDQLRDFVARNLKLVRYYDKSVLIFETQAQNEPSHYGGVYLTRHGNELSEVPSEKYGELFRRFQSGF